MCVLSISLQENQKTTEQWTKKGERKNEKQKLAEEKKLKEDFLFFFFCLVRFTNLPSFLIQILSFSSHHYLPLCLRSSLFYLLERRKFTEVGSLYIVCYTVVTMINCCSCMMKWIYSVLETNISKS